MTRRRDLLRGGGCLAAGLVVGCGAESETPVSRQCPLDGPPTISYGEPSARTETIAATLLDATEDDVFAVVTARLREHPVDVVLGALLVAGARAIPPDSGGALHATLAIHAVTHLVARLPEPLTLVPVYYAAHALKFRQSSVGRIGVAPAATERTPVQARERFDAAMTSADPDAADIAVVDLLASVPIEEAIDCVIRWAPRNEGHIGHLPIWFALGIRALDTLGWSHARPVLRSIVRDASATTPGALQPIYEAALPELEGLAAPAPVCTPDDGLARELLAGLRTRNPEDAAAFMLERVRASSPDQALWDGFALSGTEDLIAGGAGVALHRFDTFNAMHHLYRRTLDPVTRQMLLVATAAYACTSAFGEQTDVLALDPVDAPEVDAIFDAVTLGPERAAQTVLGYVDAGGSLEDVERRAEELAVRKAHPVDEHDYKFPVAVVEQTELTSASLQPWVLAAIGGEDGRSPGTAQPDWEHLDEVLTEIERL